MKLKARYKILIALASIQLVLVGLGAASVDLGKYGPIGRVLQAYGEISGAASGYGFFAPGIDGQLKARFEVVDDKGHKTQVPLANPKSHEAAIRIGDITDQFWDGDDDKATTEYVHRSLAASLVGKLFWRYPQAKQIVFRLDRLEPVSMAEFRQGERAKWETVYSAVFQYDRPKGGAR